MKVIVRVSKSFKRQAKPLLKKFSSLTKELIQLENEIIGLIETEEDKIIVNLISIYDKSETTSISDKELRDLIAGLQVE